MRTPHAGRRMLGALLPCVLLLAVPAAASAAPDIGSTSGEPVTVTLNLTGVRAQAAVEKLAVATATPGTAGYRKYLDIAQVKARFGAPAERVQRVTSWAAGEGLNIGGLDATGTRLTVAGSTDIVQRAFAVTLRPVVRNGVRIRTASSVTIPAALRADVSAVGGLTPQVATPMIAFPGAGRPSVACLAPTARLGGEHCLARPSAPGQSAAAAQNGTSCATSWGAVNNGTVPQKYPAGQQSNYLCGYTGAQLRALYGLTSADTGAGQTIVIVGAYNRTSTLADANATFARTGAPALPADRYQVKTYTTGGGTANCDQDAWGWEQALDVQTAHTLAPAAKIVYAAAPDCTRLEDTLAGVIADTSLKPTIVSNSWGIAAEPSDTSYLAAMNILLSRATIMGVGTYVASGDWGDTTTAAGTTTPAVSFPASSPWTTAVGGTTSAISGSNGVLWQTGWENAANTLSSGGWTRMSPSFIGGAGGGRSARFDKPSWQSSISGSKRAVPDIAALADPYTGFTVGTTTGGQFVAGPVGGTSLAAPIVASLAALAQAKAGSGSDIGLLTPTLYANAKAGKSTTVDVKHVAAGIWAPALDAVHRDGNYLIDADAGVESLKTGTGYDTVTGLGTPGRTFLTDVG